MRAKPQDEPQYVFPLVRGAESAAARWIDFEVVVALVLPMIRKAVRDRDAAETLAWDVGKQAWEKVRRRDGFRGAQHLQSWAFVVAAREITDYKRDKNLRVARESEFAALMAGRVSSIGNPQAELEGKELLFWISFEVDMLSATSQAVFEMMRDGYKAAEIAKALGQETQTIYNRRTEVFAAVLRGVARHNNDGKLPEKHS